MNDSDDVDNYSGVDDANDGNEDDGGVHDGDETMMMVATLFSPSQDWQRGRRGGRG